MKTAVVVANYDDNDANVIALIELLIADLKRIKYLKIPIKMFLFKDAEYILKVIIDIYNKNGFVNNIELGKIISSDKDFNFKLYKDNELYANLSNENYYKDNYVMLINHYQKKILENYKKVKINEYVNEMAKGNITSKEFSEKVEQIDKYTIEEENESFITLDKIDLTEKEKIYIKSNTHLLDQKIKGFALGELSVWSGGNASSKSTYLNQLTLEALTQNINVAVYSGELTNPRLLNWLFLQACGKENVIEKNGFYKPKESPKQKIIYWLNDKLFIFSDKLNNKPSTIINGIRNVVKQKNVKMVIIDNLMSMEIETNDNKYDFQSKLIKELSALAKELDIHIHFVCHPRKSMNFLRKNDISGSADLTNIADNVFIMHRNNNDFKKATKEMFGWKDDHNIYKFSNIIEICKNREFGVQDFFVGMYFEVESKRLLNYEGENKYYC